jgi:hypothetical protein
MDPLANWEKILLGMLGVLMLFLFWPGVKAAMQQSQEARERDWRGALLPLLAVVLFVILLIALVR